MNKLGKIYWVWVIVMFGIMLVAHQAPAQEADYQEQLKETAKQLVCLCGCGNQILYTCTCGEAKKNREFILQELKAGKSQPEILDMMIARYGEQVLAAPKREGINWIVWVVVPYIIPLLGALGVAWLIMRWARHRQLPSPVQPIEGETLPLEDEYKQKLEDELKDFE